MSVGQQTIEQALESGLRLHQAGRLDEAEAIYRKALETNPGHPGVLHSLGLVAHQSGRSEEAVEYIERAIRIDSSIPEYFNNLAQVYRSLRRPGEAERCCRAALRLKPDFTQARSNLAVALHEQSKLGEALEEYRQVLAAAPHDAVAYSNLGALFQAQGKFDAAETQYRMALTKDPKTVEALNNLGFLLGVQGRFDESLDHFEKALELSPSFADAHVNRALLLLQAGNYLEGWKEYEWRWESRVIGGRSRWARPRWSKADITGRKVLLFSEQGVGDTFQFIRYAPLIARAGAEAVYVECQPEVKRLLEGVSGVTRVFAHGEQLPEFDLQAPLMSLPGIFGTTLETIPAEMPYLKAHEELVRAWRSRLDVEADKGKIKVGLVWAGSAGHANDRARSCPLAEFAPLSRSANGVFYSLQKGDAAQQASSPPSGMKLIDPAVALSDFSDTAALIMNLDLVISVDTAAAHLAGALGKPVWVLLPFPSDWRWLRQREDSPWYPSARLFRQKRAGDWAEVFMRVAESLADYGTGNSA